MRTQEHGFQRAHEGVGGQRGEGIAGQPEGERMPDTAARLHTLAD